VTPVPAPARPASAVFGSTTDTPGSVMDTTNAHPPGAPEASRASDTDMDSQCLGPDRDIEGEGQAPVRLCFSRHGVSRPRQEQRPAFLGLGRDASWRRTD
jgi:hypothetical protein